MILSSVSATTDLFYILNIDMSMIIGWYWADFVHLWWYHYLLEICIEMLLLLLLHCILLIYLCLSEDILVIARLKVVSHSWLTFWSIECWIVRWVQQSRIKGSIYYCCIQVSFIWDLIRLVYISVENLTLRIFWKEKLHSFTVWNKDMKETK
jgi:hypothetical protein